MSNKEGWLLRHFDAAENVINKLPPMLCPTTGKVRYARQQDVPLRHGRQELMAYWCGYCENWHCSSRTKSDWRTVQRRMGRGKLYPGETGW